MMMVDIILGVIAVLYITSCFFEELNHNVLVPRLRQAQAHDRAKSNKSVLCGIAEPNARYYSKVTRTRERCDYPF